MILTPSSSVLQEKMARLVPKMMYDVMIISNRSNVFWGLAFSGKEEKAVRRLEKEAKKRKEEESSQGKKLKQAEKEPAFIFSFFCLCNTRCCARRSNRCGARWRTWGYQGEGGYQ